MFDGVKWSTAIAAVQIAGYDACLSPSLSCTSRVHFHKSVSDRQSKSCWRQPILLADSVQLAICATCVCRPQLQFVNVSAAV